MLSVMPALRSIVIHCRDPYVLAPFWSLVTGLPIFPEDAEGLRKRSLGPEESVLLGRREELHIWITPAVQLLEPGRIHLDIACDDDERATILLAGATVVRETGEWTVVADPEGNEFCLVPTG
jgi:hypothetical protein